MFNKSEILAAGILIVDDRQANVSLLQQLLKSAGKRSATCTAAIATT